MHGEKVKIIIVVVTNHPNTFLIVFVFVCVFLELSLIRGFYDKTQIEHIPSSLWRT
jgi:hypothetical protein